MQGGKADGQTKREDLRMRTDSAPSHQQGNDPRDAARARTTSTHTATPEDQSGVQVDKMRLDGHRRE